MFHAPDHFNLKTRGQPERWVILSWNPQQHKMAYGWCYYIWGLRGNRMLLSCCNLKVHGAILPWPSAFRAYGLWCACLTHNRGEVKNVPFSVTTFFSPFVCPLTCYVTGQLNYFYFLFSGKWNLGPGKSPNRRGFIIWCNLLWIQFQGSIITSSTV